MRSTGHAKNIQSPRGKVEYANLFFMRMTACVYFFLNWKFESRLSIIHPVYQELSYKKGPCFVAVNYGWIGNRDERITTMRD